MSRLSRLSGVQERHVQRASGGGNSRLQQQRIQQARGSGVLNLQGMGLTEWPEAVLTMFDSNIQNTTSDNDRWWESVELTVVNASNNKLREIPAALIEMLGSVHTLQLEHNELNALPERLLASMPGLQKLNIAHNQQSHIPEFPEGSQLCELIAAHNAISEQPESLASLPLSRIDLSHNALVAQPSRQSGAKLTHLDLSFNQLTHESITPVVSSLRGVTALLLSHNALSSCPSLASCTLLTDIDLSFNMLTSLPLLPPSAPQSKTLKAVSQGLKVLTANHNHLTDISSLVASPPQSLQTLTLNDNLQTTQPPGLSGLSDLATLNQDNNELSTLPVEIGFMTSLQRISLQGNPLRSIPRAKRDAGAHVLKEYLKMRGSDSEIQDLERSTQTGVKTKDPVLLAIHQGTSAKHIIFSDLKLAPDLLLSEHVLVPIGLWGGLKTLEFVKCCFSDIDSFLTELSNTPNGLSITSITLKQCSLDVIPASLFFFKMLQDVDISGNEIGTPSLSLFFNTVAHLQHGSNLHRQDISRNRQSGQLIIPSCPSLHHLVLDNNRLTDLEVDRLENLRTLRCSDNCLEQFPFICITDQWNSNNICNSLEEIHVNNNNITSIDPTISHPEIFKKLKTLAIAGNPITQIRQSIVTQGSVAVLQALRMKIPQHILDAPELQLRQQFDKGYASSSNSSEYAIIENEMSKISLHPVAQGKKPLYNDRVSNETATYAYSNNNNNNNQYSNPGNVYNQNNQYDYKHSHNYHISNSNTNTYNHNNHQYQHHPTTSSVPPRSSPPMITPATTTTTQSKVQPSNTRNEFQKNREKAQGRTSLW